MALWIGGAFHWNEKHGYTSRTGNSNGIPKRGKKNPSGIKQNYPSEPIIKFVKKANMWCITSFKDNEQTQEWFVEQPRTK